MSKVKRFDIENHDWSDNSLETGFDYGSDDGALKLNILFFHESHDFKINKADSIAIAKYLGVKPEDLE